MTRQAQGAGANLSTEVRICITIMKGKASEWVIIEPFEDEIHPRLRFAHRGLVAMANNGTKNSNDSQFIITLGEYLLIFYSLVYALMLYRPCG